jgi:prepilin-type N-terminal cleavage/methylation domain-containing protein
VEVIMPRGFTLIELLVVVTIIVVLLALLTPALDQAMESTVKMQCLANTRGTAQGCAQYAFEQKKTLPIYTAQDQGRSSAYDMRTFDPALLAPRYPLSTGLLVSTNFLPSGPQLGKIAHCPVMDNSTGPYKKHCMDLQSDWGWGASFWSENLQYRIINGYSYRAASYYNAGKSHMKANRLSRAFLLYVDVPDVRFRGSQGIFVHPDGYNRAFGDGSASFLEDPEHEVERRLRTEHPGGSTEGIMHGGISSQAEGQHEERIWDLMAIGSVVEAP